MTRWAKKTAVTIVVISGTLLILAGLVYAFVELSGLFPRYIERNPKKIIAQLERVFAVDFSEEIKEVKAASTRIQWDGNVDFILKFTAEPDALNGFLKLEHTRIYETKNDQRGYRARTPKWFIKPITNGTIGKIRLEPRNEKIADTVSGQLLYIYIDTTDRRSYVVYIDGAYDTAWVK